MEGLTKTDKQALEAVLTRWAAVAANTEPVDRGQAEEAIASLYAQLGKPRPVVLHCDSPLQLGAVLLIFRKISHFDKHNFRDALRDCFINVRRAKEWRLSTDLEEALEIRLLSQTQKLSEWDPIIDLREEIQGTDGSNQSWRGPWSRQIPAIDHRLDDMFFALADRRRESSSRGSPANRTWWHFADVLVFQLREMFSFEDQEPQRIPIDNVRSLASQFMLAAMTPTVRNEEFRDPLFLWHYVNSLALTEVYKCFGNAQLDPRLNDWVALGMSVPGFLPFERVCFTTDRPRKLSLDAAGRMHGENGPAVVYSDGFLAYAWHGIGIPARKKNIICAPNAIKVSDIEEETNIAIRRVMIERFGQAKYIEESGAEVVDRDVDESTGHERVLYRKSNGSDEPIVMLRVVNSTPEPDGSYKHYFIRVPPAMQTARDAVAWTFGLKPDDYNPTVQT